MTAFGPRLLACAIGAAAVGAGAQTVQPHAGPAIPPPVVTSGAPSAPMTKMLHQWIPGAVTCGNRVVVARIQRPVATVLWTATPSAPQTYGFRVDATGRPLSIVRRATQWATGTDDIAPSLAASHVEGGAAKGCTITYTSAPLSFAEAPLDDLVATSLTPARASLPPEAWARLRPASEDCGRPPRPQWLTAALPDYAKLPGAPGVRDWSLVGYDLDAAGRPKRVHRVAGSGNAKLDAAAVNAMARSQMTGGARTGCRNPFVRNASLLSAPAMIDSATFRPVGANCPEEGDWARKPVLTYPASFRQRSIEGWAVIGFDVAPWGGTGNIKVLASEPAEAFGEQGRMIIGAAQRAASATGYTGCVERVRFVMGPGVLSAEPETRDTQPIS